MRSGKGSFTEKAKILDSGSLCNVPESTGSTVQSDPYLISITCSETELSSYITGYFGRSGKLSFTEKAKIVDRGSQ